MKTKFFLILILAIPGFTACKKQLTEKPYAIISPNNFYNTQADFETAVYGVIALMNGTNVYGQYLHYPMEMTAGSYNISFADIRTMTYTSTNQWSVRPWDAQYNLIQNCNIILSRIDDVSFDSGKKNALKGETLFIRANAYFNLVRMYGGVPLYLEPTNSLENASRSRASVSEVYDVIVKDLKEASEILLLTNPYGVGRPTRGAALGMLVKVYIQMAGKPLNETAKWQQALDLLKQLVDVNNPSKAQAPFTYHLEADFQNLFWKVTAPRVGGTGLPTIAKPANENGPESVYEINYKRVSGLASCVYPESIRNMAYTPWLNNKFDAQDYRRQVTMVIAAGDPLGALRLQRKFQPTGDAFNNSENNWPLLRFADLVLLLAEAENEINGPTPLALSAINAIRTRARQADGVVRAVPANYTAQQASSKEALRLLIEKERILELCGEGQNYYDFIRTNRVQAIMTEQGRGANYDPNREIFPIPQTQIDLAQGVLVQSPGY